MKDILHNLYYQNNLMNWGLSIGIIILSLLLGRFIMWIFRKVFKKMTGKTKSGLDDLVVDNAQMPVVLMVICSGIYYALYRLNIGDVAHQYLKNVYHGILTLAITFFLSKVAETLIQMFVIPLAEKSKNDLDDQLVPILKKGVNIGIWAMGILVALNNAGFNVSALLAGMGIGGLAFAMAAKDTVSNVFGGVTIFTDRPFRLGDRIKLGGYDGYIVEIGVRSTRLKTLAGTIVTIPNTRFTDSMVENVSMEPTRKVILNLGLTYDTPPEEMQKAIDELDKIAKDHAGLDGNHLISFNSFGDFSLGIIFIYYIKKSSDIFLTQTEVNLLILERFNANNWSFAFPTQTIEIQKES